MTQGKAFAMSQYKAWMVYAHKASDGTIFVPAPVALVASANLAILQIKNEKLVNFFDHPLFANPRFASYKAKQLKDSYERRLGNDSDN